MEVFDTLEHFTATVNMNIKVSELYWQPTLTSFPYENGR